MEDSKIYQLLKGKSITESSLKLYMNNLKRLNDGKFPDALNFLKDVPKIMSKLEKYKPTTQRSYIVSIVTSMKELPKMKKTYKEYYDIMLKFNNELKVNNKKSESQKENWIDQKEVKHIYDLITNDTFSMIKENSKLTKEQYDKLLHWFVLSLYVLQPPRRNIDYQLAHVCKSLPSKIDNTINYLDMSSGNWSFNNYKTKGTYKTQEVKINPEMSYVINTFLNYHPLVKEMKKKNSCIPLLVDYDGNSFKQTNTITRMLNKIFGKKIGVSMLRNIYLTDKFGDEVNELRETSEAMGTSSSTIQNNYVKVD